ncbi:MAG TPA: response regulator [Anaerolineaceae bacterium]|nr:response regulator [Anaerolineaceae bacterium]
MMAEKHVLIVDDAIELGRLLQSAVQTLDASLKLTVVPSAEEAILASSRHTVQLLISDVRLPGMSGFDLAERMRKRNPNLEVILITGMTDRNLRKQAEESGAVFFQKPLKMDAFLAAVQKSLGLAAESAPPAEELAPQPVEPPRRKRSTSALLPVTALQDVLSVLQQETNARLVVLFNTAGDVTQFAGNPPGDFAGHWAAPLLASLAQASPLAVAAGRDSAARVCILRSENGEILAAAVHGGVLAVEMPAVRRTLRLALALDELLTAQAALDAILGRQGADALPVEMPTPQPELPKQEDPPKPAPKPKARTSPLKAKTGELKNDPSTGELESALKKAAKPAKNLDPDAFWEQATSTSTQVVTRPDVISFDQAAELGLAPSEDPQE